MSGVDPPRLRSRRGTFATPLSHVDLYLLVREIAELAVELGNDALKNPRTISQSAWDAAMRVRSAQEGRTLPPAREICRRLRDHAGRAYPWEALLKTVFTDDVDFAQHHGARLSQPDRSLTDEHVYWALNHVAHGLDQRSLRPREYEQRRQQLLDDAQRSPHRRRTLELALPNANQITTHSGGWDRALQLASLEPRSNAPRQTLEALTVPQALGFFFLLNGYLPSQRELTGFLDANLLACQRPQARPWGTWCEEAAALLEQQGVIRPNAYPSKEPPAGWRAIELDLSVLPRKRKSEYTRLEVLEAVHDFLLSLPASTQASDRRYKQFAHGAPDVPALSVVERHGGLRHLQREVARPDWREEALRQLQLAAEEGLSQAKAATEARQTAKRDQPTRRRDPEKRMTLMLLLRDHGPLASRELVDALGVSRMRISKLTSELRLRGLIATTEPNPRSRKQRYTLTASGSDALTNEAELRELLAAPPARTAA